MHPPALPGRWPMRGPPVRNPPPPRPSRPKTPIPLLAWKPLRCRRSGVWHEGIKAKGLHDLMAGAEDLVRSGKFDLAIADYNKRVRVAY